MSYAVKRGETCSCEWCGAPFLATKAGQGFHSESCRLASHNRRIQNGIKLFDAAVAGSELDRELLIDMAYRFRVAEQERRDRINLMK
jgi:hypothetical protein